MVGLLLAGALVCSEPMTLQLDSQRACAVAVHHTYGAYVEPARAPGGEAAMRIQFIRGPGAPERPAVSLGTRPECWLPADWSRVDAIELRLFNPGPATLSLKIQVRSASGEFTRSALLAPGRWRTVAIRVSQVAAAGVDVRQIRDVLLRPAQRHTAPLTEIYLAWLRVRWRGAAPRLPAIQPRQPAWGPARSISPPLERIGRVRWAGMSIPVVARCDVLVAGAGLAGVAAAVAAGRAGAHVILVERSGAVGGMATSGLVPPAMRPELAGGLVAEFLERLRQRGGEAEQRSPEVMKAVLLEMLREARVRLLLYTTAVAPLMRGRYVTGCVVYSKAGFQAIRCRVLVDCTGDADIAARSGAPFQIGRGRDRLTQAMTLMFLLGNVDTDKFPGRSRRGATTEPYVQKAKADGWWDIPFAGGAYCEKVIEGPHGVINVNCMNIPWVNPLSPADLTYAHVQAFDIAWRLVEFFRRYVPGCENCYLVSSASFIGVRESRRILGEYVLTAKDVLSAATFDDGIARGFYPIDVHSADGTEAYGWARLPAPYEIPYRCLVPRRVENLLVAGRPISADHVAHGSLRVMGTTMALGQAAGTAAALCVKLGATPRKLDGRLVRGELEKAGALPPIFEHVPDNPAMLKFGTVSSADSCLPRYAGSERGAIDGIVAVGSSSRWVSSEAQGPHWLELHFPAPVRLRGVTLHFWPAPGGGLQYLPKLVQVQVRSDGRWITVAENRPDELAERINFAETVTRRLRLLFPEGSRSDWIIRLREVVVEGEFVK